MSRRATLSTAVALLGVLAGCVDQSPLTLSGAAAASDIVIRDFPPAAPFSAASSLRRGTSGTVLVRITIAADGRVEQASIEKEVPAVPGLGNAALRLARAIRFTNLRRRPVIISLQVIFPNSAMDLVDFEFPAP